jgi:hypothetical protein
MPILAGGKSGRTSAPYRLSPAIGSIFPFFNPSSAKRRMALGAFPHGMNFEVGFLVAGLWDLADVLPLEIDLSRLFHMHICHCRFD